MQVNQQKKRTYASARAPADRVRAQLDAPRRRTFRPANDNAVPIAQLLERGALVLVPLMVFLLLAYVVISPR